MLGSKTRGGGQEESCHLKIPKRDQFRENITSFPRRTFSPFLPFFSSRKFAKKVGSSGPFFGFSKLIFFFLKDGSKSCLNLFSFRIRNGYHWPRYRASLLAQMVKNMLQCGRPRLDPWVGKIPWRREWQDTGWANIKHKISLIMLTTKQSCTRKVSANELGADS